MQFYKKRAVVKISSLTSTVLPFYTYKFRASGLECRVRAFSGFPKTLSGLRVSGFGPGPSTSLISSPFEAFTRLQPLYILSYELMIELESGNISQIIVWSVRLRTSLGPLFKKQHSGDRKNYVILNSSLRFPGHIFNTVTFFISRQYIIQRYCRKRGGVETIDVATFCSVPFFSVTKIFFLKGVQMAFLEAECFSFLCGNSLQPLF